MIYNTMVIINNSARNREVDFPITQEKHYVKPNTCMVLIL